MSSATRFRIRRPGLCGKERSNGTAIKPISKCETLRGSRNEKKRRHGRIAPDAIRDLLDALTSGDGSPFSPIGPKLIVVGHRIVNGGSEFDASHRQLLRK